MARLERRRRRGREAAQDSAEEAVVATNSEERRSRWWWQTEGKREGEATCRHARPWFCQAERLGGRTTGWSIALTCFFGVEKARLPG
jgi:hypothetical protein